MKLPPVPIQYRKAVWAVIAAVGVIGLLCILKWVLADLLLDYLKVLLSAPVVTAIVLVYLLHEYKPDLKALMGRIGGIKFPGGELSMSQAARTAKEESAEPALTPRASDIPLPKDLTLNPAQVDEIQQIIAGERTNALLWEFRYLNRFLVPRTQVALDWLASISSPPTLSLFDNFLQMSLAPEAEERKAIFGALASHWLIDSSSGLVQVTPKGREYIGWRGPLPFGPNAKK